MLCPRCNTELPDSASVCTRCGSPVFAAASMQAQAPGFSYLPPGAPRWPTTAFPHTAYALAGQTQGAPTSVAPGPGDRDNLEPEPPRRKRSTLSVPFILLLLLGSILVGGGLTYGVLALQSANGSQQPQRPISLTPAAATTPSATPTTVQGTPLPTPTSFQSISITDVGVSTRYPSDWTADAPQKNSTSAFISIHPTQPDGIAISFERFSQTTSASIKSTQEVNQANFTQFQNIQGIKNFQVVASPTPQQNIGGITWDEQDATFSNSNNVVFHVTTLAVQYKQIYYDIVYYAPDVVYSQAVQKYFQPMLASLKFLS